MLGESPRFLQTLALLKQIAPYDAAVLIEGAIGPQPHRNFIGVFRPAPFS
jgi:hypothetical protein